MADWEWRDSVPGGAPVRKSRDTLIKFLSVPPRCLRGRCPVYAGAYMRAHRENVSEMRRWISPPNRLGVWRALPWRGRVAKFYESERGV